MTTPSTDHDVVWRVTGVRRWIPVLLLAGFALNGSGDVVRLVHGDFSRSDPRVLTTSFVVFGVVGVLASAVLTVVTWRTRVAMTAHAVEVSSLRRRTFRYEDITRAYRDRFTSGAVTLLLADERKVRLPAPVAGLGASGDEVDEAVEQIRARLSDAPAG